MPPLSTLHALPAGQACSYNPAPGTTLQVHNGLLWVTQSGQADDHFVAAGQCLVFGQSGGVVLENSGSGSVVYAWILPVPGQGRAYRPLMLPNMRTSWRTMSDCMSRLSSSSSCSLPNTSSSA